MIRILLLLTIILAAIPIKSHAVVNTVNIDTVWSLNYPSGEYFTGIEQIKFINDSLSVAIFVRNSELQDAVGLINSKAKTLNLIHFSEKWTNEHFTIALNKSRTKVLMTCDSTFYVLNSNTLVIEDSIKFSSGNNFLYSTNSDSVVYMSQGDSFLYSTKDTVVKFNYITKNIIETYILGNGGSLYSFAVHPNLDKALFFLREQNNGYATNDTIYWLDLSTKEIKYTDHKLYKTYSGYAPLKISPDGNFWILSYNLNIDDKRIPKTKIYNMSDSIMFIENTNYIDVTIAQNSNFIILSNRNTIKLMNISGFSTMYLDSNWNRGKIDGICKGDSLFWSFTNKKIYLNRIGEIQTSIIESKNGTRLYPNPTGNEITIRPDDINFDVEKIKIFDSNGNQIDEYDNKNGSEEIKIDLGRYSNGMYMILLQSKDKSKSYKVIKE